MSKADYTKAVESLHERADYYHRKSKLANQSRKMFFRFAWFMAITTAINIGSFFYSYWILSQ